MGKDHRLGFRGRGRLPLVGLHDFLWAIVLLNVIPQLWQGDLPGHCFGIFSRMRLDRVRPSAMCPVSSSNSGSEAMSEIHPSTASPYTFACFVELRVVPANKCANIATVQFPTQGMPLQHSSLWKSVCRGELRARGARNQWPPSTSQNRRGADNRPGASKRGTALSPCNLVLKPTSGNTEIRARTSIETTAGEIGTADPGMARLAGKRNGSGPGNTEDARDRQPTHWGGRSSRPQAIQRAGSKPPQPKHVCQKKWAPSGLYLLLGHLRGLGLAPSSSASCASPIWVEGAQTCLGLERKRMHSQLRCC